MNVHGTQDHYLIFDIDVEDDNYINRSSDQPSSGEIDNNHMNEPSSASSSYKSASGGTFNDKLGNFHSCETDSFFAKKNEYNSRTAGVINTNC